MTLSTPHPEVAVPTTIPAAPGCLSTITPSLPLPSLDPIGESKPLRLAAFDAWTGKRSWSIDCSNDEARVLEPLGKSLLTSCGEGVQVISQSGDSKCRPKHRTIEEFQDEDVRGMPLVAAIRDNQATDTFGFNESCDVVWHTKDYVGIEWNFITTVDKKLLLTTSSESGFKRRLVRANEENGRVLWRSNHTYDSFETPLLIGQTLAFGSQEDVVLVDADTGTEQWRHHAASQSVDTLTSTPGRIVASAEQELIGLDYQTGRETFRRTLDSAVRNVEASKGNLIVQTDSTVAVLDGATGKTIVAIPAGANTRVALSAKGFAVLEGKTLRVFDPLGRMAFSALVHQPSSPPVVDSRRNAILIVDAKGQLNALDIRSGKSAWAVNVANAGSAPKVIDDLVLLRVAN